MSFEKKTWSDRVSEYPTRRNLIKADGTSEIVTVERSEGEISTEGDAFSAENMNDFEERVAAGFEDIELTANKIKFSSTVPGLESRTNVQSAIERAFQYGNNIKAEVVDSLQYSGLGITDSMTWSQISARLKERFPNTLVVYNHGEFPSPITTFTTKSELYPAGQQSSAPGWGVTLDFKTDYMQVYWSQGKNGSIVSDAMIDVTNFSKIKIEAPTLWIGNDDPDEGYDGNLKGVLYKGTTGADALAKVFNLNEEFDLNGINGRYYVGVFGYGAYAQITNITLTA